MVHFWTFHKTDQYKLDGQELTGGALREQIRREMYEQLTGDNAPYNRKFVTNGVACTTATVIAAALGFHDITTLSAKERAQIQQCHLLLVMYNALQPGVFALSGWDLVGALTLPTDEVAPLIGDGDTRWINRGAYDLMAAMPTAAVSQFGLPKATALYGSLPEQMAQPTSFANQLKAILAMRRRYRLYESHQLAIPGVIHPSLLLMVHRLPDAMGIQVTALNFGPEALTETLDLGQYAPAVIGHASRSVVNMLSNEVETQLTITGELK